MIVSNKRKSSGLTLPVFCQRPVGFLRSGLRLPAAMVTGCCGLQKKHEARLTLLFHSGGRTSSLSGPGPDTLPWLEAGWAPMSTTLESQILCILEQTKFFLNIRSNPRPRG